MKTRSKKPSRKQIATFVGCGLLASSVAQAKSPLACFTPSAALCGGYDFTSPITIETTGSGPALLVNGGKVGIGLSAPANPLSVAGVVESTAGGFKFPDGSVQTTAATGMGGTSSQWADVGNNIAFNRGSVGIGVLNPAASLEVGGTVLARGRITAMAGIAFADGTIQNTAATSNGSGSSPWQTNGSTINYSLGNVGIGTNAPASSLHVAGSANSSTITLSKGTDNSYLSTWDYTAGYVKFGSKGFDSLGLFTNNVERMRIDKAGNIGIGITNPVERLTVLGDGSAKAKIAIANNDYVNGSSGSGLYMGPDGLSGNTFSRIQAFQNGNTAVGNLVLNPSGGSVSVGTNAPNAAFTVNGDASKVGGGSWATFSDARLKTVEGKFTRGMQALSELQPVSYHYNENNPAGVKSEGSHIGFVAQEVQKVIPEAVTKADNGYLMVNNDPILWTMVNAVKEAHAENEKLRKEVTELRAYLCEKDPAAKICE